jgi:salicylate hydroxylase
MAEDRAITIVGGGLAGLATARALNVHGFRTEIFEAARELGEIGAAVGVASNATKAIEAIGLGDQIATVGNLSPGIYTRNMNTGAFIEFVDRRKEPMRWGARHYSFHRADLLGVLAGSLDPSTIHLGHQLVGLEDHGKGVTLSFANGVRHEAEVVIAADGVRSVVRQALYGDDNPTYTGQMVWRALLKGGDVPPECLEPNGHVQWV